MFAWPGMGNDVKTWARFCPTRSPSGTFSRTDGRFSHFHLEGVGPLPSANDFAHLLTSVDCYTSWSKALQLTNAQADTFKNGFFSRCVAFFGTPSTVSTDGWAQLASDLLVALAAEQTPTTQPPMA
ncbi:unnamed protein product [Dibothriocephalus latus]|uniref:Uncharacterized protein n=1 Tax=Dibothriocephalus latus TaxID=60516 RepID=A0A3P7LCU2_DIBLA|nr:unnamed protein product [Dibothriocephalus latus]